MKKIQTLNQNKDFTRLYRKGKNSVDYCLVTYVSKNRLGYNRIGITTSKKVGKACQRNRAKRVIREAYRLIQPELLQGYDIVFVARTATVQIKMQKVQNIMRKHLAGYFAEKTINS